MSAGEVHHVSDATCESARAPIPFDRAVLRLRARVREVMCSARLRRTRGGRDRAGGRARPFSGLTKRPVELHIGPSDKSTRFVHGCPVAMLVVPMVPHEFK